MKNDRIEILDSLRGLAALGVCVFHIICGSKDFLPDSLIKVLASYGHLGIEVFFVISGYIIPYSMYKASYQISGYLRFLARRLVRLEPPYLACILLILVLNFLASNTPGFAGPEFKPSFTQILAHLAYLNAFFELGWLNVVFWTLAIEFQFYLLIGLLFPLLTSPIQLVRITLLSSMLFAPIFFDNGNFIFHWLHFFMFGNLAFLLHQKFIGKPIFALWLTVLVIYNNQIFTTSDVLAGLLTSLVIAIYAHKTLPFEFLGKISYSLYLLHVPIGGKIINLGARFITSHSGRLALACFAITCCVIASYIFYLLIEEPARRWSRHITYKKANTY